MTCWCVRIVWETERWGQWCRDDVIRGTKDMLSAG
jgi:hypothetical protein